MYGDDFGGKSWNIKYVRLNVVLSAHTEVRRVVLGYGSGKLGLAFICYF